MIRVKQIINKIIPSGTTNIVTKEIVNKVIDAREVVHLTVNAIGSLDYVTLIAGESINGNKVVYLYNDKIYAASIDNPNCYKSIIGITENAVTMNESVRVKFSGELDGFSFTTNGKKYLGLNGDISESIPTQFICCVGNAISNTKLLINMQLLTIKRV